jgi:dual specificity phosphatase 12
MDSDFMASFLTPMHKIDNNLYLGGLMAANNYSLLTQNGIRSIVQALSKNTPVTKHPGFNYHVLELDDAPSANIAQFIPEAIKFIDRELMSGKTVLIHCAAGISRSSSVAVAYFMVKYNFTYDEALAKVRKGRGCACPNQGFENQLRGLNVERLRQHLSY